MRRIVSQKKIGYAERFRTLLKENKNFLIISIDNVGSHQLQQIRASLRGLAIIIMGKNTVMRHVLRELAETTDSRLSNVLPLVRYNVGFVFTNGDVKKVRGVILENKVPAAARLGVDAPCDVFVFPGSTGLDPGQTNFFQALNIATKISRGSIEIISKVHLIKKGDKVNNSAVVLLNKLGIRPFFYGVVVKSVWEDGSLYDSEILDLTDQDLTCKFLNSIKKITAIGLKIGYPTKSTLPYSFARAFRVLLSLSIATEYSFKESQAFKDYLDNPDAFKEIPKDEEETAETPINNDEEEEEESSEGGLGLFGDEDDSD